MNMNNESTFRIKVGKVRYDLENLIGNGRTGYVFHGLFDGNGNKSTRNIVSKL